MGHHDTFHMKLLPYPLTLLARPRHTYQPHLRQTSFGYSASGKCEAATTSMSSLPDKPRPDDLARTSHPANVFWATASYKQEKCPEELKRLGGGKGGQSGQLAQFWFSHTDLERGARGGWQ